MDIQVTLQDGIHVLKVSGQLDALNASDYEKQVNRVIVEGAHQLVVDFGALVYISSAGLRALINTTRPLLAQGGSLAYANLQPPVHEVFEMTGLLSLFTVCNSVSDALAMVNGR